MKTKSFLFSLFLLAGLVGFNSCSDDEDEQLAQADAEEVIVQADTDFGTYSTEMVSTDGYKIQSQLNEIGLPFNTYKKAEKTTYSELKKYYSAVLKSATKGETPDFDFSYLYNIDFESNVGTYTYSNGYWDYSPSPSDKIILIFPYPLSNPTNNVTVTYYDYETTIITGLGEVPTSFRFKIEYNDQVVYSLTFNVNYTNSLKYSVSIAVNFDSYTFTHTESIDATASNKVIFSGSSMVEKDSELIYEESAKVTFTQTGDYSGKIAIEAKVVMAPLEFRINMNFSTDDVNVDDPNDIISMSLYTTDGVKVGTFKFEHGSDEGDYTLYFYFSNGEKIPASELMPGLQESVGNFIYSIFEDALYGSK
ncbi:MAG: hypothetical protein AB7S54_09690 [Bacteroidales bacterium]